MQGPIKITFPRFQKRETGGLKIYFIIFAAMGGGGIILKYSLRLFGNIWKYIQSFIKSYVIEFKEERKYAEFRGERRDPDFKTFTPTDFYYKRRWSCFYLAITIGRLRRRFQLKQVGHACCFVCDNLLGSAIAVIRSHTGAMRRSLKRGWPEF